MVLENLKDLKVYLNRYNARVDKFERRDGYFIVYAENEDFKFAFQGHKLKKAKGVDIYSVRIGEAKKVIIESFLHFSIYVDDIFFKDDFSELYENILRTYKMILKKEKELNDE